MATKKFDAVATIGKYTDKQGNEKKRYINVGSVFESDEGHLSLKLDAVPVGQEWSGWVSFFVPKERDAAQVSDHSASKGNAFQSQGSDDLIPF